jgi:hypothetical protein
MIMKRFGAALAAALVLLIFSVPAGASSFSFDLGYHYDDGANGAAISFLYSYGFTNWFEFGVDAKYWSQFGQDEIDYWETTDPDDSTGAVHEFTEYRQTNSGFFGPVFRFPLTWLEDRKIMFVPTLGIGVEAYSDREWDEETVKRPGASDSEFVHNDVDRAGFGWYIRPGLTFVASWWRLSFEQFTSQDGAAQFEIITGVDIMRVIGIGS